MLISRKWCKTEIYLQCKANRKSYMAYQMAATVMTLNDLQGHSPVAGLFNAIYQTIVQHFTRQCPRAVPLHQQFLVEIGCASTSQFGWAQLVHHRWHSFHQGAKQKLRAGYRMKSPKRMSRCDAFSLSSVISCTLSALCTYSKFGHHTHLLGYLCPKFRFYCSLHCWASPWRKITAYSLIQLIWCQQCDFR